MRMRISVVFVVLEDWHVLAVETAQGFFYEGFFLWHENGDFGGFRGSGGFGDFGGFRGFGSFDGFGGLSGFGVLIW